LNLINNARQAIEGAGAGATQRGLIRVTSELRDEKICITFRDNGPGISEQNLSKIFDPFFTTKEVGKGTGLGLSLCCGIIKDHGGTISVHSKPGEGATFIIELLPAVDTALRPERSVDQSNNSALSAQPARQEGKGKSVLVIDDEDAILHMVREILAAQGYEVDVARDGESALQSLEKRHYDLALCDWKMPGLTGEQVYERIRTSNPALSDRMIFITGDVINDRTQQFLHERNKVCLSKPFSVSEFREAVGKALGTS
jgi:CheY-like chemotaxis protein